MCGICGYYRSSANLVDFETILKEMNRRLVHRGPDDGGTFTDGRCGLAMRRLSIIDLKTGHQPIASEDGRYVIVFNGEIYNYRELRRDLTNRSHSFLTSSDTEVVLKAYIEYGRDCVQRFIGMFAFAIYDVVAGRVFLARDHFGVKPLYYMLDSHGNFYFSSELDSLVSGVGATPELNYSAMLEYASFTHTNKEVLFKGVLELTPGSWLEFQKDALKVQKYWHFPEKRLIRDENEMEYELDSHLQKAIQRCLISDVSVGALLSGGIDSSVVMAYVRRTYSGPMRAYTITFDDPEYDELGLAKLVASHLSLDHVVIPIKELAFDETVLEKIIRHFGQPFADSSAIPMCLVAQEAARYGKVVLSGDGGDELFFGYDIFQWYAQVRKIQALPLWARRVFRHLAERRAAVLERMFSGDLVRRLIKAMRLAGESKEELGYRIKMQNQPEEVIDMLRDGMAVPSLRVGGNGGTNDLEDFQRVLFCEFLPSDMLAKVDRMSMASSLEVRVPFLDQELVDFSLSTSAKLMFKNHNKKFWLKRVSRSMLPKAVFDHKKWGFAIPLHKWFDKRFFQYARDMLLAGDSRLAEIFDQRGTSRLIDDCQRIDQISRVQRSRYNVTHQVWMLLLLECWLRTYRVKL